MYVRNGLSSAMVVLVPSSSIVKSENHTGGCARAAPWSARILCCNRLTEDRQRSDWQKPRGTVCSRCSLQNGSQSGTTGPPVASPHPGAHVAPGDTPTCAKNSPVSRVGAAEARYTWIKPHRAVGIPPGERVEHVAVGRGQCRQGRENEALHHRPRLRRCVAARCWTNREPPSEQFAAECFWLLVRVSALMSASLRPSRGRPALVR